MELGKTHYSQLVPTSPILFTCEHATDRIPLELGTLGLEKADLDNCKDLYDPGALDLVKKLAEEFSASLLWSDLSRLVIDANRYFDAPNKNANSYHTSLLKRELLTTRGQAEVLVPIPHNQSLSEKDERSLYDSVCVPYQEEMLRLVSELKKTHAHVYIVSIHSFFPEYAGKVRTVDIDVMGYVRSEVAPGIRDTIRKDSPTYVTEVDKPWSVADVDGGALHVLKDEPGITIVVFDIKNDNLKSSDDIAKVAKALMSGITPVLA